MSDRHVELSNLVSLLRETDKLLGSQAHVVFMSRDTWYTVRKQIEEVMLENTGMPMPFVNLEYYEAGIDHFLVQKCPIIPM